MVNRKKIVLILVEDQRKPVRCCLDGFMRFARRFKWNVQLVEGDPNGNFPTIDGLLKVWQPIGAVVFASSPSPAIGEEHFGPVPVVYVDSVSASQKIGRHRVVCDSSAIGRMAAKDYLARQFRDLAYVPYPNAYEWCRRREEGFAETVAAGGGEYHRVGDRRPGWSIGTAEWLELVGQGLQDLPKPCALLAANDFVAMQVINLCHQLAISVPEDVAVMGVDNDEAIDLGSEPSITSIEPDFARAGHAAAAMLERLIRVPGASPDALDFSARRIVRRGSTSTFLRRDPRVREAVAFIQCHAMDGIGVESVVRAMGCSRRLAELRFRETLAHSISDEIALARVAQAENLLRNTRHGIPMISDACGFGSVDSFRRTFIRIKGVGPLEYRISTRA